MMAEGSTSTTAATFRAKATFMKSWKPLNPPSNRDRLELYALHKQAVSGDAPANNPADASVADKAKLNAWRSKRGLSQSEAMTRYVAECDRQLRNYGTQAENAGSATDSTATTPRGPSTPTNTPAGRQASLSSSADGGGGDSGVLLTPRGLAAVPLLCAAAAESRPAYLTRLSTTPPDNGWWARQEPLCADPGTAFALPEAIVLAIAAWVEKISLSLETVRDSLPVSPAVPQAFLWPLHNVLLALWILLIFIGTLVGSSVVTLQTILLGSKRTSAPLDRIFAEEIVPAARAAQSLCEPHQAISVRLSGLSLMPLVTVCDASKSVTDFAGLLAGASLYVLVAVMTWWYWMCVLPWCMAGMVCCSIGVGWCFALIQLAGM